MSNNNQKLQRRLWKISQSNNEFSKIQCFRKEVGNECFKQILFSVHKSSGDTISHLLSRLNKIKTLRSLYNEFKLYLPHCFFASTLRISQKCLLIPRVEETFWNLFIYLFYSFYSVYFLQSSVEVC